MKNCVIYMTVIVIMILTGCSGSVIKEGVSSKERADDSSGGSRLELSAVEVEKTESIAENNEEVGDTGIKDSVGINTESIDELARSVEIQLKNTYGKDFTVHVSYPDINGYTEHFVSENSDRYSVFWAITDRNGKVESEKYVFLVDLKRYEDEIREAFIERGIETEVFIHTNTPLMTDDKYSDTLEGYIDYERKRRNNEIEGISKLNYIVYTILVEDESLSNETIEEIIYQSEVYRIFTDFPDLMGANIIARAYIVDDIVMQKEIMFEDYSLKTIRSQPYWPEDYTYSFKVSLEGEKRDVINVIGNANRK